MWINRAEYEKIKNAAEKNECDADMFRRLVQLVQEKKTIIHGDFIIMSRDVYDEVSNKLCFADDKVKDIQAELEWYKVKYHEMKMNTEQ